MPIVERGANVFRARHVGGVVLVVEDREDDNVLGPEYVSMAGP